MRTERVANHLRSLIDGQKQKICKAQERLAELESLLRKELNPTETHIHNYCGKILYPSKAEAKAAMKLINADLQKRGQDLLKRSYFCADCEAWHLTTLAQYTPATV